MKTKLIALLALCFAGNAGLALAAKTPAQAPLSEKVKLSQIDARAQKLQEQLQALQAELKSLQQQKGVIANGTAKQKQPVDRMAMKEGTAMPTEPMSAINTTVASRYSHGLAVVASPFLGQRDVYSVYDLVVNLPSMNQDLILLKQRQKLENYAIAHNEAIPDRPLVDVSGGVEGEAMYSNVSPTDYTGASQSDINLTTVKLDVIGEISKFVTAEAVMEYEKYPPSSGIYSDRVSNSRIKLGRGFLTIGNLNAFPVYGTLGQVYAPFGKYSNYMVSDPLTQLLARVKTRPLILGFYKNGFYGQAYAFRGDAYATAQKRINQGGINLGKEGSFNKFTYDIGAGFIANMADAAGMQEVSNTTGTFAGFAASSSSELLVHRVPGVDVHLHLGYDPIDFVAEYITPTRSFDPTNLSFDGKGAKPRALDVEASYSFTVFDKPSSISIGTGRTWQALALNLPEQNYFAALSTSLWKYSIESLEFLHDRNYVGTDTASGTNSVTFSPAGKRDRNIITAKIGVYF